MSVSAPSPEGWAAERLTAYLSSLASIGDRAAVIRQGLDLVAEALEAEVAALVIDGAIEAVIGFPPGQAPAGLLIGAAESRPTVVDIPSLGPSQVLVAPIDSETSGRLLVARVGDIEFSQPERHLFRGMSRVLSLYLTVVQTLEAERAVRTVSEGRAAENAALLRAVQERQALLERLTRIQRRITRGAPLDHVLDAVVSGAADLLSADVVTLRRVSPEEPQYAELLSSAGIAENSPINRRVRLGTGASGRAITEGCLVVMHDYPTHAHAYGDYVKQGIQASMAAPVHENGEVVGSLLVASLAKRRFSRAEQDMLLALADHASLAITDARSAEALRQALHDAQHDAMHDVLTGLPNRALLKDRITHAWNRSRRSNALMALLFLDLDNFKHINDSLGHDAGDKLLISVGKLLGDALRPSDTIARLGGDEFAVLMEDLSSAQDAEDAANRLLAALNKPVKLAGRQVEVTTSIGIAISADIADSRSLLRSADLAMYAAKRLGGGRSVRFQPDMHRRTLERLDLEHDLRRAIDRDQLVLHYQPIVDLATGDISGVEALVRWHRPKRGIVPPSEFIPVAESSRLIHSLGEWVLRKACTQLSAWPDTLGLSVNISPRQVDADLPELVSAVLHETGIAPCRLTLEVTEGIAMAEEPERFNALTNLQQLGVQLAIDDFGTGYSSLARLRALPVDLLKIDRTFVADVNDCSGAAIVGAIISLSRAAGLIAVAEGVETVEQLDVLRDLGCQRGQGYLLGRPVPAAELSVELGQPAERSAS